MNKRCARVIVTRYDLPPLLYSILPETEIIPGDLVEIPLKNSITWGIVEQVFDRIPPETEEFKIKPIFRRILSTPLFADIPQTDFLFWVSEYYCYPFGKILKQIFTPFLSAKNTIIEKKEAGPAIPPLPPEPVVLTKEQSDVTAAISKNWKSGDLRPVLLHGVTGSGKSEVYAALCREVFARGKQVLYLVPEIGLTEGTLRHLEKRLGTHGVLLHSGMSKKQRRERFLSIWRQETKLIVGTRSALLYPLQGIGLIIVDEEHDPSYKNLEPPYYHGRDAAVMKGHLLGLPVILGSATPSSESWHNSIQGKYLLVTLPNRANDTSLPLPILFPYKGDLYLPSGLIEEIRANLSRQKQSLFFLNRRGFATISLCSECGYIEKCDRCDTALVFHKKKSQLLCHHCLFHKSLDTVCPECSAPMTLEGMGIEKLLETIKSYFPSSVALSFDRDNISSDMELAEAIEKITDGRCDIILGTIMISKGHNFPHLKTVVIKYSDYMLNFTDYRASERCFQIVTQVAGRAGRFQEPGSVWVETTQPGHYIWKYLSTYDYAGFINEELAWRKDLNLPPYTHVTAVRVQGSSEKNVDRIAEELYTKLSEKTASLKDCDISFPFAPPLHRIHGKFRKVIMVKTGYIKVLRHHIRQALEEVPIPRSVSVTIDIDSLSGY